MTLEEIRALEAEWIGRVPPDDPDCFGWEPYDLDAFTGLLEACLPHVPAGNRTFVDAGCGIGTKCLLAAQAGLGVYGIDLLAELLDEARMLGVDCDQDDARTWNEYGEYGLVYLNHPLNCGEGCDDEALLENRVHELMASGSVLLSVNHDLAPGCPVHPASSPCTDGCPEDSAAWPEITRNGRWAAAWVKP